MCKGGASGQVTIHETLNCRIYQHAKGSACATDCRGRGGEPLLGICLDFNVDRKQQTASLPKESVKQALLPSFCLLLLHLVATRLLFLAQSFVMH